MRPGRERPGKLSLIASVSLLLLASMRPGRERPGKAEVRGEHA